MPVADPEGGPGRESHHDPAAGRRGRCGAVRTGARRCRVRADRAAASRVVESGGGRVSDRGRAVVLGVPRLRVPCERSDAAPRSVQEPELRGREHRDARAVRRTVGAVLLPRPLPPAGRRLHPARIRSGVAAREPRHVRAVLTLWRARRPFRPAPVHGRRPAGRGCRHAPAPGLRRAGPLPDRSASRDPRVLAGPVDDGRAAHRSDSRRHRRERGGNRLGRQQRCRPSRRPDRDGGDRCARGRAVQLISGQQARQSSLVAFRVGVGVASGLVIIGGLIGAGIRNPRRVVRASQCSGGQLAGAPLDAAGLHAPQRGFTPRKRPELSWRSS